MRTRRALMYVPGDDPHKITKAAASGADCVCLDMEDGVAITRKDVARAEITTGLRNLDFGRTERLVRINPPGTGLEDADLTAALSVHPDGIVIPKVDSADPVQWASQRIAAAELINGWQPGSIALLVGIESARGILNLQSIATADSRLQALIFGAEDLASDLGAYRTREGWEVFHARSAVILHAAAFGLQAIDMVWVGIKDLHGLAEESRQAAGMGFSGKQIIHPSHIEPVQQAFTPDKASLASAKRLINAFEEHQKQGKGVFVLDGKMVDMPMLRAARRVVELAGNS